jgi:hypothetical protein
VLWKKGFKVERRKGISSGGSPCRTTPAISSTTRHQEKEDRNYSWEAETCAVLEREAGPLPAHLANHSCHGLIFTDLISTDLYPPQRGISNQSEVRELD